MSGRKEGAYGTSNGGDTSFRKTWDRDEAAARAKEQDRKKKEEGKARHEAALAGKKYHRRASTPPDARETEARASRLDVGSMVGKTQLVAAGAAVGKRGKGAGFYCEHCDLTFKDNIQYVEHLNSKQHLVATGQTGEVKRATVQEVHHRLLWLKRKADEAANVVVDLDARMQQDKEREDLERAEKRRKRNEKRRKTPGGVGNQEIKLENDGIIC